jgi:galactokinase
VVLQARAPGRVNLIGEHTDYNDGFVMPCAIAYDTHVRAQARNDRTVRACSFDNQSASFNLERLRDEQHGNWTGYIRGILAELRAAGADLTGADLQITGNVPIGAGLSSSASLEIAVALAMLGISRASMPPRDLALLAQRAEAKYAGTRCGIMDQFTVLFAQAGNALFLDTRSLEFQLIEVPSDAAVVLCNTMVKHSLASSAYNERRAQCEEGVRILQQRDPVIRALRDVTLEVLEAAKSSLRPVIFARCRHVITENARAEAAAQALRARDLDRLGALMYVSHVSLRDDYEVSCEELDLMVNLAKQFEGTIGARMTGGGFGGCTVNLVRAKRAQEFRAHIRDAYRQSTGITPELYDGTPSAGASILDV